MQIKFTILIFLIFPSILISRDSTRKIDSVAFHSNGNLAYVKEHFPSGISEYTYHENGRASTIKNNMAPSYSFQSYSASGKLIFDTSYANNYYVTSSHYYPGGAKKSYYSKKLRQQRGDSPILIQYLNWDENGELNYFKEIDTSGRVAADEKYPLRKYRGVKFHRFYYPSGYLKEQGFYKPSMIDSVGAVNKFGVWFTFFSNGKLESAGLFIENIPWGLHYQYDSTGKLLSLKYFVKGVLVEGEPGNSILPINFPSGKDTVRTYQWNHFGNEGLYESSRSYDNVNDHSYYFHGANLANTPDPSPKARERERIMLFGFPPGDVWCTWSLYSVRLNQKGIITQIGEGISENGYNFYEADNSNGWVNANAPGNTSEWNRANAKTKYSYNSNGTISKIETTGQQRTWFIANSYPVTFYVDTTRIYDENGKIYSMIVYGTRGQILKTMNRNADSSWTEIPNPLYQHFYIKIKNNWVEIMDHDVTFSGEWKFVCENGNMASEGFYAGGKNGLWKDYTPKTGKLLLVQHYEYNQGKAKGIYKRYDEYGGLEEKGKYDDEKRQTGVWKLYSNGKRLSRIRYFKGYEYGFVKCKDCCPNKKGKERNQLTYYWKGDDIWKLRKCVIRPRWF